MQPLKIHVDTAFPVHKIKFYLSIYHQEITRKVALLLKIHFSLPRPKATWTTWKLTRLLASQLSRLESQVYPSHCQHCMPQNKKYLFRSILGYGVLVGHCWKLGINLSRGNSASILATMIQLDSLATEWWYALGRRVIYHSLLDTGFNACDGTRWLTQHAL